MDMNWYMKKMLVTEHQHDLLATADRYRQRRQVPRSHGLRARFAGERPAERPADRPAARKVERPLEWTPEAARRPAIVPCTPTCHS
jgi:hypothetical protein